MCARMSSRCWRENSNWERLSRVIVSGSCGAEAVGMDSGLDSGLGIWKSSSSSSIGESGGGSATPYGSEDRGSFCRMVSRD